MLRVNPKLNKDVYSTIETKTNKVWIDNKPIYRKTYTGNAAKSTGVNIEQLTFVDNLVNCYGWAESNYDWTWAIPNSGDYQIQARFRRTDSQLQLYFGTNFSSSNTFVFTIEYTKTTD